MSTPQQEHQGDGGRPGRRGGRPGSVRDRRPLSVLRAALRLAPARDVEQLRPGRGQPRLRLPLGEDGARYLDGVMLCEDARAAFAAELLAIDEAEEWDRRQVAHRVLGARRGDHLRHALAVVEWRAPGLRGAEQAAAVVQVLKAWSWTRRRPPLPAADVLTRAAQREDNRLHQLRWLAEALCDAQDRARAGLDSPDAGEALRRTAEAVDAAHRALEGLLELCV